MHISISVPNNIKKFQKKLKSQFQENCQKERCMEWKDGQKDGQKDRP